MKSIPHPSIHEAGAGLTLRQKLPPTPALADKIAILIQHYSFNITSKFALVIHIAKGQRATLWHNG
jgi:hypothetical protein